MKLTNVGRGPRWRPLTASPARWQQNISTGRANDATAGKGSGGRAPQVTRRAVLGARFFLPKSGAGGHAPELGRELPNEGEARVEALKLGVTYYSVQEWRPVADFAGKNPELKREAVPRKGTG